MNVLVTDGNNRAALAITRSLGRKGYAMMVGESRQPSLARSSRYCAEGLVYPDPTRDSAGFVRTLLSTVRTRAIDVVLPVSEISTSLVVEHKSAFEAYCRVPFADIETFNRAADKVETLQLAERLGIPAPVSVVLRKPGDRPTLPAGLDFPIVVKPHRSRIRTNEGWRPTSVAYARSEAELERVLDSLDPGAYPILLQQRVIGPGIGVFMCYCRGRRVAVFSHRRVREKPPSGGVSVLCESTPLDPSACRSAEMLLDHLQWHGVAMVEFKVDQNDGIPKLMEINGRFWGSLQLAIEAGVDFPSILVNTVTGVAVEPVDSYRIGVKSRWLLGDVDALLARLTKPRRALNLPPSDAGTWHAIRECLKLWEKEQYYDVWKWSDMRPGLHELAQWLRRHG